MSTNQEVLSAYEENSSKSQQAISEDLKSKFPFLSQDDIKPKSLCNKVKALSDRVKRLRRNKQQADIEKLLSEAFVFKTREQLTQEQKLLNESSSSVGVDVQENDKILAETVMVLEEEIAHLKRENEVLRSNYSESAEKYEEALLAIKEVAEKADRNYDNILSARNTDEELETLKGHMARLQTEYEEKAQQLKKCEETLKKHCPRNLKRKSQRHVDKIAELKSKFKQTKNESSSAKQELEKKIDDLMKEKELLQNQMDEKTEAVDSLMASRLQLQKRCSELRKKGERKDKGHKVKLLNETNVQWQRIKQLEKDNKEMKNLLDMCEGEDITTFEDGKYTDTLREVVISLLNMNISLRNISPAIKIVIEKLTNMTVENLPAYGTVHKMMYEAKCLALIQAGRAMLHDKEGKAPANILMNDGTTKRKRKYNATCVATSEGVRNIGLSLLASETSEALLKSNMECFSEVEKLVAEVDSIDQTTLHQKLLSSIRGTMLDRAEVMKKFNRLLSDEISEALTEEQKQNTKALQNHYCFLHVIINLGDDACQKGLMDLDNCTITEESLHDIHKYNQSSTYSAIYSAARLFHQMGSEIYGKSSLFDAFLTPLEDRPNDSKKGAQTLSKKSNFEREVGNRAHITFHNANALYFHRKSIEEFIQLHKADGTAGEAMKQLDYLMNSQTVMAGARALGIIKCCLTGPFQSAFDQKCSNILEMVPYVIQMRAALQEYSEDASELLQSPRSGLPGVPMWETQMTNCLFEETGDSEFDALTVMAIHLILANQLILFERQCEMYLPGGEFGSLDKNAEDVRNCLITNRHCESVMGALDRDIISKPNVTPCFIEARTILKTGQLEEHFEETDPALKKKEFSIARKFATKAIETNKQRLKEYVAAQRAIMKQKEIAQHNKKIKETVAKSKIIAEITKNGGEWKSSDDIDDQLSKIDGDTKRRKAIEWQLRYHKTVLQTEKTVTKEQKKLFRLTKVSLAQLVLNLKEIVKLSPHIQHLADLDASEVVITGATILTKEERKELFLQRVTALKEKLKSQREKRDERATGGEKPKTKEKAPVTAKRQKLDLPIPASLIGKQIQHTFRIVREGAKRAQNMVFTGTVLRIVKRAKDPLYTLFEIQYGVDDGDDSDSDSENEEELPEIFQCELLVDFVNGDVKIID